MSQTDFFDDVESVDSFQPNDKPFWALNLDSKDPADESEIHKWLASEMDYLKQENRDRFTRIQRNLALYKGIQYQSQETREGDRTTETARAAVQKIVCNQIYDLVQNSVARLIKYRPAVAILPTNDEFNDKIAAENVEAWLNHIQYIQNYEGEKDPEIKRLAKIMGEAYMGITWDPNLGDLDQEYRELYQNRVEKGEKVPLLDEGGKPELHEDGTPILVDAPVYNGDVKYEVWKTTDILLERAQKWDDVRYLFRREVMETEKARLLYPKSTHNIESNMDARIYDYEKMEVRKSKKNEVILWHFYFKRTKELDQGRYIVFTQKGLVSNTPYPYNHKELPCKRYTDRELPGELHGVSGIDFVKGLTGAYNNLTNMIVRNQIMAAHPKWMMPAGAAKLESLGNDITICQFKGPQAPQLVQCNPTPSEVFKFRDILKEEAQAYYGIGAVQRGNPPAGIKAGIALQFLAEQESERQNEDVLKSNELTKQIAQMAIAVAGDYYPKDEQRQIRVLGKNNSWKTVFFNTSHLSKDYDIRIQNSSALPQSKAARTQTLIDLKQSFPTMMSDDQFLDLLGLAQDTKFTDIGTVSVRAAEAENEAMLDPSNQLGAKEPEEYEDLIAHWNVHARALREWSFKHSTPPAQQERLLDHVMATEALMEQKAFKNPGFFQKLQMLSDYPLVYTPAVMAPKNPQDAAPPAQDNVGILNQQSPPAPVPLQPINPDQPGAQAEMNVAANPGSVDAQMGSVPPVPPSSAQ